MANEKLLCLGLAVFILLELFDLVFNIVQSCRMECNDKHIHTMIGRFRMAAGREDLHVLGHMKNIEKSMSLHIAVAMLLLAALMVLIGEQKWRY